MEVAGAAGAPFFACPFIVPLGWHSVGPGLPLLQVARAELSLSFLPSLLQPLPCGLPSLAPPPPAFASVFLRLPTSLCTRPFPSACVILMEESNFSLPHYTAL